MRLALIALASTLYAGQSLSITSTGTVTFPAATPWTAIGTYTGAFRVSGISTPASQRFFFQGPSWRAYLSAQSEICLDNLLDTMPDFGSRQCVDITGVTDAAITFQRDTSGLRWRARGWNVATGAPLDRWCGSRAGTTNGNRFDCPIATLTGSAAGAANYGGSGSGAGDVAWLKLISGLGQLLQPYQQYDTADLLDLRLEGNGTDSSGRGLNMAVSGASYSTTPAFAPVPIPRVSAAPSNLNCVALRAGASNAMDGSLSYSRGDTSTLTYSWLAYGGPSRVVWSSQSVASPSVSGLIASTDSTPYVFALTVTDSLGQSSTASLDCGAVAMDSNGVLIANDPNVYEVFGPQIAFGKNPWPAADERHKVLSEFFGDLLTTDPDYIDTWHPTGANTAYFENGNTVVTRVGGANMNSILTDCQAANDGDKITVAVAATNGVTLESPYVATCSAGSVTLRSAYTGTTGTKAWGRYSRGQQFQMSSGMTNANYYDVALAHLDLWQRSGNRKYRDYGMTLARRWWASPSVNRVTRNLLPRVLSPWGLWACAVLVADCESGDVNMIDFRSDYDTSTWDDQAIFIRSASWISDMREEAYRNLIGGYLAQFCPACVHYSNLRSDIATGLAVKWYPNQQASGTVLVPEVAATDNVDVTNGSATVTRRGSFTFSASDCSAAPTYTKLVAFRAGLIWDVNAYTCTYDSPTQITLNTAYTGPTGTRLFGNTVNVPLVGQGTQPFVLGIPAIMAWRINRALNNTSGSSLLTGANDYIRNLGFNSANNGLYYGRGFPGCEPPTNYVNCLNGGTDIGDEGARFFAAEPLASFAFREIISPDASNRTRADLHYGRNFGRDGGPSTNGEYYTPFYGTTAFTVMGDKKAKDFGFAYGVGRASAWPAARVGGVAPPSLVSRSVQPRLADRPGALSMRVTAIRPNGDASSSATCTTGPCTVQIDTRMGTGWNLRIEYFSGASGTGTVLTSATQPVQ